MGRKKIYDTKRIPKSVQAISRAICADYARRKKELPSITDEAVRASYVRMNEAVDAALLSLEEGPIREVIGRDILSRRGYEMSTAREIISVGAYYARRRQVLRLVAEELALI